MKKLKKYWLRARARTKRFGGENDERNFVHIDEWRRRVSFTKELFR
jgi:hypothetical protein